MSCMNDHLKGLEQNRQKETRKSFVLSRWTHPSRLAHKDNSKASTIAIANSQNKPTDTCELLAWLVAPVSLLLLVDTALLVVAVEVETLWRAAAELDVPATVPLALASLALA